VREEQTDRERDRACALTSSHGNEREAEPSNVEFVSMMMAKDESGDMGVKGSDAHKPACLHWPIVATQEAQGACVSAPSPEVDAEGGNGGSEARRDADPSNPSNPEPEDIQLPAPPGEDHDEAQGASISLCGGMGRKDDVCFDQAPHDPVGESGRHVWSDREGEAVAGGRKSAGWAVSVSPVNPFSSEDGGSMQDASSCDQSPTVAALAPGVCVCVCVCVCVSRRCVRVCVRAPTHESRARA